MYSKIGYENAVGTRVWVICRYTSSARLVILMLWRGGIPISWNSAEFLRPIDIRPLQFGAEE
jgi:hypothetical protein